MTATAEAPTIVKSLTLRRNPLSVSPIVNIRLGSPSRIAFGISLRLRDLRLRCIALPLPKKLMIITAEEAR